MLEEQHPLFGMPRLTKATADGNCLVIVLTKVRAMFSHSSNEVLTLLVCGREDYDDYRLSSARPVVIGRDTPTTSTGTVGMQESEPTEGNDGIVTLVKYICKIHGFDLEAVNVVEIGPEAIRPRDSQTRSNSPRSGGCFGLRSARPLFLPPRASEVFDTDLQG